MNSEIQNLENIQLNTVFLIIFDSLIDLASEQIVLDDLIVNEKYLNSFFAVKGIGEAFAGNI